MTLEEFRLLIKVWFIGVLFIYTWGYMLGYIFEKGRMYARGETFARIETQINKVLEKSSKPKKEAK